MQRKVENKLVVGEYEGMVVLVVVVVVVILVVVNEWVVRNGEAYITVGGSDSCCLCLFGRW